MTGGSESWLSWVFKFINFAVLVGVIVKFGAKPLKEYFINKHTIVKDKIEEADRMLKEAQELKATYESKLGNLDKEIEAFKKTVLEEAENEKKKVMNEAMVLVSKLKEQAAITSAQEAKEVSGKIKEEIVRLTMEQAEKLVKERLTKEDHNRMVEEFIEKMGSLN
ncbi:MAG: ATP synthase F0 subunit B [Proteobacteria bacterium]|nr:ATP synthase F0 subunit B [Pseudomonadota bacterium]